MSKKNISENFNIHIVEDHNEALKYIYKEIGTKQIRFSNLTIVHFDSHPDLSLPDFNADDIFSKEKLFDNLSIENWICPAVYAGHFSNLIWIKPAWSKQIETGLHKINVGKDIKNGMIRCDSRLEYFTSGSMYSPSCGLINSKTLNLYVCDFEEIICSKDELLLDLIKKSNGKNLILDIDLDFFSTQNPFLQMFKSADDYSVFKNVYSNEKLDRLDSNFDIKYKEYIDKREKKLDQIKKFVLDECSCSHKEINNLKELIKRDGIDFEILHSYGSGIDSSDLPHHLSTAEELNQMYRKLENFFKIYFLDALSRPGLVTVARSSLDDYCPSSQVDLIQIKVLQLIEILFKNYINKVNHEY